MEEKLGVSLRNYSVISFSAQLGEFESDYKIQVSENYQFCGLYLNDFIVYNFYDSWPHSRPRFCLNHSEITKNQYISP